MVEKEVKKEYEAFVTKRILIEMENEICTASVTVKKGDDISTNRHVDINEQINGGEITFEGWN